MTDNFPLVPCKPISNVSINYNGNLYTQFYSYPNPLKSYYSKSLNDSLFKNTTDDTAEREMAI